MHSRMFPEPQLALSQSMISVIQESSVRKLREVTTSEVDPCIRQEVVMQLLNVFGPAEFEEDATVVTEPELLLWCP